jgi:hypothetical protein
MQGKCWQASLRNHEILDYFRKNAVTHYLRYAAVRIPSRWNPFCRVTINPNACECRFPTTIRHCDRRLPGLATRNRTRIRRTKCSPPSSSPISRESSQVAMLHSARWSVIRQRNFKAAKHSPCLRRRKNPGSRSLVRKTNRGWKKKFCNRSQGGEVMSRKHFSAAIQVTPFQFASQPAS